MDRNVSYLWIALLMDDNTLHFIKPGTDIEHIYPPVSTEPEPRTWRVDNGEAVILDDGNLFLHTDDEFAHAVYYPFEDGAA